MKYKSIGASDTVTGSAHLIFSDDGFECLLDFGMFQGLGKESSERNSHLGINPSRLKAVLLSHAHIDHSGRLPLLVKQGYTGPIYATSGTFDLCRILLLDSAHIQEADVRYVNKYLKHKGQQLREPLYTVHDAERCLKQFKPLPYRNKFSLHPGITFQFIHNGHITGSAAIELEWQKPEPKKLLYTGDVGRYQDLLLKHPEPFDKVDFIITESTYGDRLHEPAIELESNLLNLINTICIQQKGKLFIPAFSLGRTQELVFIMDRLKNKGLWPSIPVFVDSPLSCNATQIVRSHTECFNSSLSDYIKTDPDPFGFNQLRYVNERKDSKILNQMQGPAIIISASGMADAGRIKHHLLNGLFDEKNAVLMVGYCSPGSLGHQLMQGQKEVRIFGQTIGVKASIHSISSLSAHADARELLQYLTSQDPKTVKRIFLVHGEEAVKKDFKNRLRRIGFQDVEIPVKTKTYNLF